MSMTAAILAPSAKEERRPAADSCLPRLRLSEDDDIAFLEAAGHLDVLIVREPGADGCRNHLPFEGHGHHFLIALRAHRACGDEQYVVAAVDLDVQVRRHARH